MGTLAGHVDGLPTLVRARSSFEAAGGRADARAGYWPAVQRSCRVPPGVARSCVGRAASQGARGARRLVAAAARAGKAALAGKRPSVTLGPNR